MVVLLLYSVLSATAVLYEKQPQRLRDMDNKLLFSSQIRRLTASARVGGWHLGLGWLTHVPAGYCWWSDGLGGLTATTQPFSLVWLFLHWELWASLGTSCSWPWQRARPESVNLIIHVLCEMRRASLCWHPLSKNKLDIKLRIRLGETLLDKGWGCRKE